MYAICPRTISRPLCLPRGNTRTRYFYNFDRQPTQIFRPDLQSIDFDYDTAGRLKTIITPRGETVFGYNETRLQLFGGG